MRKKVFKQILYTFIGAAAFVALWWIVAAVYDKPIVFPTPAAAVRELFGELKRGLFWRSFGYSYLRSIVGFLCAAVAAVILAFLGKACPPLKSMISPIVGILRSLPTMSVILLLVLWTTGSATPIIVSALVIFPVLYSGMDAAVSSVPRELEETARLYAPDKAYVFFKIHLPLALPPFLTIAGGAASLSLKLTVAAEVLAQTRLSLGMMMQQTRIYFEVGRLMALTLAVVVAALVTEFAVYLVRRAFDYEKTDE